MELPEPIQTIGAAILTRSVDWALDKVFDVLRGKKSEGLRSDVDLSALRTEIQRALDVADDRKQFIEELAPEIERILHGVEDRREARERERDDEARRTRLAELEEDVLRQVNAFCDWADDLYAAARKSSTSITSPDAREHLPDPPQLPFDLSELERKGVASAKELGRNLRNPMWCTQNHYQLSILALNAASAAYSTCESVARRKNIRWSRRLAM